MVMMIDILNFDQTSNYYGIMYFNVTSDISFDQHQVKTTDKDIHFIATPKCLSFMYRQRILISQSIGITNTLA